MAFDPKGYLLHYVVGFLIAGFVGLFIGPLLGLLCGATAGVLKEVIDYMGFGDCDIKDFLYTSLGALTYYIIMIII